MPRAVMFTSNNSKFLGEKQPQFIGQGDGKENSSCHLSKLVLSISCDIQGTLPAP